MKKPLHKHIGHHVRKVHGQITKYLYERDTIFATLWVFVFIVILGLIPLNLGILNPIKLGLKDFDFNDMYYSKVGNKQEAPIDNNIIVVNIGQSDREGIAQLIDKVASYKPKVIGLDVLFDGPRDPAKDSILRETVRRNKNLVLAGKYQEDAHHKLVFARNYFQSDSTLIGYANFPYNTDRETIRYYFPFKSDEKDHNRVLPSFTSTLIKQFDSAAYLEIEHKVDKKMIINYTRTLTDTTKQYWVIEPETLMADEIDSSRLKGKIALLSYVNIDVNDIEDKKFTPMNEKYAGKTVPDMNGILVHANILSMVMEKNYIKKVPLWMSLLIAVVVCWLHMSFFIRYYLESHIWFHLIAKLAQVASAIFFVWLGIYLFDRYHLKVDLKMSLIVIVMAVDVIYFYEAWAVWMHKKFNYQTVFKPHLH